MKSTASFKFAFLVISAATVQLANRNLSNDDKKTIAHISSEASGAIRNMECSSDFISMSARNCLESAINVLTGDVVGLSSLEMSPHAAVGALQAVFKAVSHEAAQMHYEIVKRQIRSGVALAA